MGSTPNVNKAGPTIGTTTKVIWIKSSIKPKRKIIIITTNTALKTPPGRFVKTLVIKSSPPNPLKTRENIDEPKRIINTMAVISVVVSTASVRFFLVRLLLLTANINPPKAPTPAASVGVAMPARMEPRTEVIKTKGGNKVVIMTRHLLSICLTSCAGARPSDVKARIIT